MAISLNGRKCLCVSGKVDSWCKHFDIIILDPMFYLKLCDHIYILITITTITVFREPRVDRKRVDPAKSIDTLMGGIKKKETLTINVVGVSVR